MAETFEGVTFDESTNWERLVVEQLQSGTHRGRNDFAPGDWLVRAWKTLPSGYKGQLENAIYDALTHSDEDVRMGALRIIDGGLGKLQYSRILPLAETQLGQPEGERGGQFSVDLVRLASGATGSKGKRFRRKLALDKTHGVGVLAATVRYDVAWVIDNAARLVDESIDPQGKRLPILLFNLFRHHKKELEQFVKALKDEPQMRLRLSQVIKDEVSDKALRDRLLATL